MSHRVYAKIGEGQQQFGGQCPPDWVRMREPRPDGDGWIASEDGEWYVPDVTMEEEIEKEQTDFDSEVNLMNQAWLAATVRGGPNEIAKKESIINEIAYIKKKHSIKISEILERHGV